MSQVKIIGTATRSDVQSVLATWNVEDKLTLCRSVNAIASAIVIAVISPLLLILGTCAKLSTGGSALFRQQRLGLGGRTFMVAKFRTLVPHAPCDVHKIDAEHLATRIGRIMRRFKLDELPQLWNIVRGDMYLVGPRPIIPEEYQDTSHYARLTVRPGLTGLWQLSPARGERFDLHPEYDLFYMANRRLSFDVWLIWRTVVLMIANREVVFDRVVKRWERDPAWRLQLAEWPNSEEVHAGVSADFGGHALGTPILSGRLEVQPASAPSSNGSGGD